MRRLDATIPAQWLSVLHTATLEGVSTLAATTLLRCLSFFATRLALALSWNLFIFPLLLTVLLSRLYLLFLLPFSFFLLFYSSSSFSFLAFLSTFSSFSFNYSSLPSTWFPFSCVNLLPLFFHRHLPPFHFLFHLLLRLLLLFPPPLLPLFLIESCREKAANVIFPNLELFWVDNTIQR